MTAEVEQLRVENREDLVDRGNEIGESAALNRDWKSQISLLREACRIETEPKVLINWIAYQAARVPNWTMPEDVAKALTREINWCIERSAGDKKHAMALVSDLVLFTYRAYTAAAEAARRDRRI